MKKLICALLFSSVTSGAYASLPPFTGLYDIAISKGTGVGKIIFVMGGEGEQITGMEDPVPIRKMFRANVISLYRCYASSYGSEAKTTGQMTVRFRLTAKGLSEFSLESAGINSSQFTECVQSAWNKLKPDSLPPEGKSVAVAMPVRAELRH